MKLIMRLIFICQLLFSYSLFAEESDVIKVSVSKTKANTYLFDVTISHNDTGWDHYVNKWDIVDDKGNVLGTRTLYHPHVDEQPFTRSLSGVEIPSKIQSVSVRAHDLVDGYGGRVMTVKLP